jgi:hypothetical protein
MTAIDDVLAEADRAWNAYGVGPDDRAALADDLRVDLAAAAADGVDPRHLIGGEVPRFARRLADESGVPRAPREYARLLTTGLLGAALAGAAAFFVLLVLRPVFLRVVDVPRDLDVPIQVAVGLFYGLPAALVVAGIVVAVRLHLRDLPKVRQTARWMALLLPPTGIAITPVTMGFAYATGYRTDPAVVLTEIALVLGALAGATVLARRLALRERPARPRPVGVGG